MKIQFYNPFKYLKKHEWALLIASLITVGVSGMFSGTQGILSTAASLIGVTALIFVAKGDAFGQVLTIVFSVFYGAVSLKFKYYGEVITYMCMSAPAAFVTLIVWLKHPYTKSEVKISHLTARKLVLVIASSIAVTVAFYFILGSLGTPNLVVSTLSVFTSFSACMLLIMRLPYYAIAYSANDIVLIALWVLATVKSIEYLPMILCFTMFLINDLYGFINWKKMKSKQVKNTVDNE